MGEKWKYVKRYDRDSKCGPVVKFFVKGDIALFEVSVGGGMLAEGKIELETAIKQHWFTREELEAAEYVD